MSAPAISSWRVLSDGALPADENMRRDEELLEGQMDPSAVPVLRFFLWNGPAISYGRLQDPAAGFNLPEGLKAVRRPTGGGVVLHEKDLSFSLAWRRDSRHFPRCIKEVYGFIHRSAQKVLAGLDVEADLYQSAAAAPGSKPGVCFSEPVQDDLMWNGQKILGGALRATCWGRLYQGSLMIHGLGVDRRRFEEGFADALFGGSLFKGCHQTT